MATPKDDQAAILAAIRDDPDDDAPRLIFADWLEEHDDPRGEFIRVQCELARLPYDDRRRLELTRREEELLQQYKAAWSDRPPRGVDVGFERGLLKVTAGAGGITGTRGSQWWARQEPWVARLELTGDDELLQRVVARGLLTEVPALYLNTSGCGPNPDTWGWGNPAIPMTPG
jgi:uncharacterized protein (TIGR02996 family)